MSDDNAFIRYERHIDSLLAQIETLEKENEEARRERDWWRNIAMNNEHLVWRDKAREAK